MQMRKLLIALLLSTLAASTLAQESSWSSIQKEVWDREETYWKLVAARDAAGYLTLWDDAFFGWPSFDKSPVGKQAFREKPFGLTTSAVASYRFEQKAVHLYGETAITLLQVHVIYAPGEQPAERVMRLTHSWQKHDGQWRIVGGLSCIVKPDGLC
jgi:ketosteroid isomerase-like protein